MILIHDIDLLERHAVLQSLTRVEELIKIFIHATKVGAQFHAKALQVLMVKQMEIAFWEMFPSR